MVFVTQLIFYFLFITPPDNGLSSVSYNLEPPKIYVFAIVTVLITLGGYLINDYFDIETDAINDKPRLSSKSLLLLYFAVLLSGFILAYGLAVSLGRPTLSLIYLVAVSLLYLYSAKWKRQVLIGNVVVSLFTAAVPMILLYAEREQLSLIEIESAKNPTLSILFFSAFTFLISMVREIAKDIEDINGDSAAGYKTLPIAYGINKAKMIAGFYGIALLFTIFIWQLCSLEFSADNTVIHLFILVFLYAPITYFLIKVLSNHPNWKTLSQLCKAIMLFGLLLLILIKCFYN